MPRGLSHTKRSLHPQTPASGLGRKDLFYLTVWIKKLEQAINACSELVRVFITTNFETRKKRLSAAGKRILHTILNQLSDLNVFGKMKVSQKVSKKLAPQMA